MLTEWAKTQNCDHKIMYKFNDKSLARYAFVLQFQYQGINTICEKKAKRHGIFFFNYLNYLISSAGSLHASKILTVGKIYCNYTLTTTQGDRFASYENIGVLATTIEGQNAFAPALCFA